MASSMTDPKAGAQVFHGHKLCLSKVIELLEYLGLPHGLIVLEDIEETGFVEETGFMWLKQKQKSQHFFKGIGRTVSYTREVTCYVEKNCLKKITGIKAKASPIWAPVYEIYRDDPCTAKIHFKSFGGIVTSYPAEAFGLEK
eukprot:c20493_g1_i1 orf=18-443(-)